MVAAQNFAGARRCSVVNSLMIKRALLVGLGFLGFCFPLAAQQTSRMKQTKDETAALRQLRHPSALDTPARLTLSRPEFSSAMHGSTRTNDLMMLTLSVGQRLPASSELDWTGMAPLDPFQDELPSAAEVPQANVVPVDGKDSPSEVVTSPLNQIYYSGELGVFYGRSQTYFLGEVGNDKFLIRVGAAYEEANGCFPRFRSFTGPR